MAKNMFLYVFVHKDVSFTHQKHMLDHSFFFFFFFLGGGGVYSISTSLLFELLIIRNKKNPLVPRTSNLQGSIVVPLF